MRRPGGGGEPVRLFLDADFRQHDVLVTFYEYVNDDADN
jgi:hypothetical protein